MTFVNISTHTTSLLKLSAFTKQASGNLPGEIKELPKGIFSNIPTLRNIYLDKNKIASLDDDTFSGDDELEEIRLAQNELADISAKVFENLQELKTVTLNGNPLAGSEAIQNKLKEAWPNATFKFVDQ